MRTVRVRLAEISGATPAVRPRLQERNRREAEERLAELIRRALVAPKIRKATRPSRAVRERRLEHKAHNRHTKRLRRAPRWDE